MTIRICTNARVIESAFRYDTALGIDDLLRAYTYESVYDGDAEIRPVAVIFSKKSEPSRRVRTSSEAVRERDARSGSIDRENALFVSRSALGRDSDLSIGTHGERALSDAPLVVCM